MTASLEAIQFGSSGTRIGGFDLFTAKALGASFNSDPIRLAGMTRMALQFVVSGAAGLSGEVKLQVSADAGVDPGTGPADVTGLSNWVDVASSAQTVTANGANIYSYSEISAPWARLVWTASSGTGTASARVFAKGI